jgi:hypothetical protein
VNLSQTVWIQCLGPSGAVLGKSFVREGAQPILAQAPDVEHIAGTDGPQIIGAERNDRYGRTLSRYELDLECVLAVAMHNGSDVPGLQTNVRQPPAQNDRVMWLHRYPPLHG